MQFRISSIFPATLAIMAGCAAIPQQEFDDELEVLQQDAVSKLRVVSANLSSGNFSSWELGHGQRIVQGVDPDVVLIQEFNVGSNSNAELQRFAESLVGPQAQYVRGHQRGIPNGIISRFPIVASGDVAQPSVVNRALTWARIDVPGTVDVYAVSVHLHTRAGNRATDARALARWISGSVPAAAATIVGGDFNTKSRTEATVTALDAVLDISGPFPADTAGNSNTNAGRNNPYDWVLSDDDLVPIPTVIGTRTFANGLVIDTRRYPSISDIAPALATDSAAPQMQHMAVVRDFALQ
jgi:endonuclease/exonuclease/phosphatase family metal-dependent hydrolase